jgi:hypothetical protein
MRSMLSEPVPAFSPAIPPQRAVPFLPVRSCSLWRNLLPGPPLSRTGSIWVLLGRQKEADGGSHFIRRKALAASGIFPGVHVDHLYGLWLGSRNERIVVQQQKRGSSSLRKSGLAFSKMRPAKINVLLGRCNQPDTSKA